MKFLNSKNIKQLCISAALLVPISAAAETASNVSPTNGFNPDFSVILDAGVVDIDNSELELPGFQLGGEAELPANGFSTGHTEIVASSNIDDKFYGEIVLVVVEEEGETILELENLFIDTLGLGNGLSLRAGKFFSDIGYLNGIHDHAHDFVRRPLVYDALFGGHLIDTGVQLSWIAPTDFYLKLGTELLTGSTYPSGVNEDGNKGATFFLKTGGDFNESYSWQLGTSYYAASFDTREAGAHGHGDEEEGGADNELLDGDVSVAGIDFVMKWAPGGNTKERNFKLQGEYFVRNEEAVSFFEEEDEGEVTADYDGEQSGFYLQGTYQFRPSWSVGYRYDALEADNTVDITEIISDEDDFADEYLEESGLGTEGDPEQHSLMLTYSPSHFSRILFQVSELTSGEEGDDTNNIVSLSYTMSLGTHAAHQF